MSEIAKRARRLMVYCGGAAAAWMVLFIVSVTTGRTALALVHGIGLVICCVLLEKNFRIWLKARQP